MSARAFALPSFALAGSSSRAARATARRAAVAEAPRRGGAATTWTSVDSDYFGAGFDKYAFDCSSLRSGVTLSGSIRTIR